MSLFSKFVEWFNSDRDPNADYIKPQVTPPPPAYVPTMKEEEKKPKPLPPVFIQTKTGTPIEVLNRIGLHMFWHKKVEKLPRLHKYDYSSYPRWRLLADNIWAKEYDSCMDFMSLDVYKDGVAVLRVKEKHGFIWVMGLEQPIGDPEFKMEFTFGTAGFNQMESEKDYEALPAWAKDLLIRMAVVLETAPNPDWMDK